MAPPPRRDPRAAREPMSDRDRTVFAAMEAVVGLALAVIGLLLLRAGAFGAAAGTALLALGILAVLQSVAVGLGLVKMPRGRNAPNDDGS